MRCGYCGKKKRFWHTKWYFGMPGFCNEEHRRYYLQDKLEGSINAGCKATR